MTNKLKKTIIVFGWILFFFLSSYLSISFQEIYSFKDNPITIMNSLNVPDSKDSSWDRGFVNINGQWFFNDKNNQYRIKKNRNVLKITCRKYLNMCFGVVEKFLISDASDKLFFDSELTTYEIDTWNKNIIELTQYNICSKTKIIISRETKSVTGSVEKDNTGNCKEIEIDESSFTLNDGRDYDRSINIKPNALIFNLIFEFLLLLISGIFILKSFKRQS